MKNSLLKYDVAPVLTSKSLEVQRVQLIQRLLFQYLGDLSHDTTIIGNAHWPEGMDLPTFYSLHVLEIDVISLNMTSLRRVDQLASNILQ